MTKPIFVREDAGLTHGIREAQKSAPLRSRKEDLSYSGSATIPYGGILFCDIRPSFPLSTRSVLDRVKFAGQSEYGMTR